MNDFFFLGGGGGKVFPGITHITPPHLPRVKSRMVGHRD